MKENSVKCEYYNDCIHRNTKIACVSCTSNKNVLIESIYPVKSSILKEGNKRKSSNY